MTSSLVDLMDRKEKNFNQSTAYSSQWVLQNLIKSKEESATSSNICRAICKTTHPRRTRSATVLMLRKPSQRALQQLWRSMGDAFDCKMKC